MLARKWEDLHSRYLPTNCNTTIIYFIVEFALFVPLPRWVSTLSPARVTRWGGMISTPDAVLQAVIKRALIESGCPSHIVNELMENAHERRWPPGLSTLETRQHNRRQYENYLTKRIPSELVSWEYHYSYLLNIFYSQLDNNHASTII